MLYLKFHITIIATQYNFHAFYQRKKKFYETSQNAHAIFLIIKNYLFNIFVTYIILNL